VFVQREKTLQAQLELVHSLNEDLRAKVITAEQRSSEQESQIQELRRRTKEAESAMIQALDELDKVKQKGVGEEEGRGPGEGGRGLSVKELWEENRGLQVISPGRYGCTVFCMQHRVSRCPALAACDSIAGCCAAVA
jgi:hypothetical protein